jgi:hypothetical protein
VQAIPRCYLEFVVPRTRSIRVTLHELLLKKARLHNCLLELATTKVDASEFVEDCVIIEVCPCDLFELSVVSILDVDIEPSHLSTCASIVLPPIVGFNIELMSNEFAIPLNVLSIYVDVISIFPTVKATANTNVEQASFLVHRDFSSFSVNLVDFDCLDVVFSNVT